ncbi:hypothetical protein RFI_05249 [Reticulomyxa filosa]|uniref:Uncharacterized protein n=1 Tax=Reticulomyxa filosa TaxID=46433 RepID=X6P0Z5_RETFI|nr:hypothetical protein RFI_05249 [Reticulomyxa filosa]|eukprot:ETO31866.1 hypothetical protein RFI_05249 [Reticulomyxa filosa]
MLFVNRLLFLATQRANTIFTLRSDAKDTELNEQQSQLVGVMTKHCILTQATLFTSCVSAILSFFGSFLNEDFTNSVLAPVGIIMSDLNICFNLWCLYFQFSFARKYYHFCCNRGETFVRKQLEKKIVATRSSSRNKIFQQVQQEINHK